jgi:hypothetical protein
MPEQKEKIRWPDGEIGVWVTFPDATCLMVDAYKGDGVEYYYRVTVVGEPAQKSYYGSDVFHRAAQTAFDQVMSTGQVISDTFQVYVQKLPTGDGAKKKWVFSTYQGVLSDSTTMPPITDQAQARVKDKREAQQTEHPAAPGQQQQAPGEQQPPPGQAGPPQSDRPAQSTQQPQAARLLNQTTPRAYEWMAAHMLRCFKLAEAVLHSDELSLGYSSEDVRATAISMSISLAGKMAPTQRMVTEMQECLGQWAARAGSRDDKPQSGEEPPPETTNAPLLA